ncbi:hypothetical protein [Agromyces larvae]|uniref:Uncharacterized protein n=1 Tax=Agromyces larvae TaxID=2929802 RepID=A0ABY4BYD7_9MICO|nr:hypothetical protein [Agromyces larvae]UOE42733.1 hypothetical protein MTO99_11075 [Agromyces larvae]
MPDLQDLLDDERRRDARPSRAPRVALIAGAVGVAVALGAGVTLAASAAASIASLEPPAERVVAESTATDAPSAEPEASDGVEPTFGTDVGAGAAEPAGEVGADPVLPPGAVALNAAGSPIYDETTDVSLIPLPADWTQAEIDHAKIWLKQAELDGDCMVEKGFGYRFTPYWMRVEGDWGENLNDYSDPAYAEALDGPADRPLGEDYDWQQAGCHGRSVHVTGMDDAH